MIDVGKDGLFSHDIFLLIFLNDVFLFKDFHGVDMFVLLVPDQKHLGVGALANN
jgi:hypothetical protein